VTIDDWRVVWQGAWAHAQCVDSEQRLREMAGRAQLGFEDVVQ